MAKAVGRPKKVLTREQVILAHKCTGSASAAARYLHVSYNHYKAYAMMYKDPETGKSLFELQKNPSGKGIQKYAIRESKIKKGKKNTPNRVALMDILDGRCPPNSFDPQKLKYKLIEAGFLKCKCARCGFKEKRVLDKKIPLILTHKDGNKNNWNLENLEFLCYNCSFLTGPNSIVTDEMVEKAEDFVDRNGPSIEDTYEMDPWQKQFLKELFKEEKAQKPGEEYITRF